jgi:geranylgeranyl diphosphate synthase type II
VSEFDDRKVWPGANPAAQTLGCLNADEVSAYLDDVRVAVLQEIEHIVPRGTRVDRDLYDLVRDYPLRPAKMLRPALAFATCRALGGHPAAVMPTAAVLELYHNAFLIHDDVEDGSLSRRDGPTLHRAHGMPVAINVGDALLALCLKPLLDNTKLIGLGRALRVLAAVAEMSRHTAEGQAMELGWIQRGEWDLGDADYLRMVHQKTTWYTFLAPVTVGALIAGANERVVTRLRCWATLLGSAFQIQDDVLNLDGASAAYGKEAAGDLWEGKRTMILLHALRNASPAERARALAALARPRPPTPESVGDPAWKSEDDVRFLLDLVHSTYSLEYARGEGRRRAARAQESLEQLAPLLDPTGAADHVHVAFLAGLTQYVHTRSH